MADETEQPMDPAAFAENLKLETQILTEGLDKTELTQLYGIRERFTLANTVRIVRSDIIKAIEACRAEHGDDSDIIEALDEQFETWEEAVNPKLDAAQAMLDQTIQAQRFARPKTIYNWLDLLKDSADYAAQKIEKTPVTTERACDSLRRSLDRSDDKLIGLLDVVLLQDIPVPEEPTPVPKADKPTPQVPADP